MSATLHHSRRSPASIRSAEAITVGSPSSDPAKVTDAICVAVAGDVTVLLEDDDENASPLPTVTVYLIAGVWHPMRVKAFYSSGTTATGIVAGYV